MLARFERPCHRRVVNEPADGLLTAAAIHRVDDGVTSRQHWTSQQFTERSRSSSLAHQPQHTLLVSEPVLPTTTLSSSSMAEARRRTKASGGGGGGGGGRRRIVDVVDGDLCRRRWRSSGDVTLLVWRRLAAAGWLRSSSATSEKRCPKAPAATDSSA